MIHNKYSLQVKNSVFYYDRPEESIFTIESISHALSGINRFNGHNDILFTVCQHSVLVRNLMKRDGLSARMQMIGLLHDGHESVVTDIPRPMKMYYREIENFDLNKYGDRVDSVIFKQLGIDSITDEEHNILKYYDNLALFNEKTYTFNEEQKWSWSMPLIGWDEFEYYIQNGREFWKNTMIKEYYELKGLIENEI